MDDVSVKTSDGRRRVRARRIVAVLGGMALLGLAALAQSAWQLSPPVSRLGGRAAYRGAKGDLVRARAGAFVRDTVPASSPVVITEVSADNRDVILDDDLAPSDWIELYNRSDRTVSLAGWRLVEAGRPRRGWIFPDIALEPRSYLIVWASGKDRVGSAAGRRVNTTVTVDSEDRHEVNDVHPPMPGGNWKIARARDLEVSITVPGAGRYSLWMTATAEGLSGVLRVRVPGSKRIIVHVPGGGRPQHLMIGREGGFPLEGVGPHGLEISAVSGAVHIEHLAFVRPGLLEDRYARQVHASFRLADGRESVMLVDPWGVVRDETPVQAHDPTLTLQRDLDTLAWRVGQPRPAGREFHAAPDLTEYPSLSPTPLTVAPSLPPGVAEIRYTLDGSVPTMNARPLDGPLRLTRPTALRLRGFTAGVPVTPIVTRQFWIGPPPPAPTVMLALDPVLITDLEIGIEVNDRWRRQQELPDDPALGPLRLTRRRDWARVRRQWIKPAHLLALDPGGVVFDGWARTRRFTTAVGPGFGWHVRTRDPQYPARDILGRPLTPPGRSVLIDEDDLNIPAYDMVRAAGGVSPLTEWGLVSVNGEKPRWRVLLEPVDDDFLRSWWGHTDLDLIKGKAFAVKRGTLASWDALMAVTERRGWTAADVAPLIDLSHLTAVHFVALFITMGTNGELWQTNFLVDHAQTPPRMHAVGWDLDHTFDEGPADDTFAEQRRRASESTERGPMQITKMMIALLDNDPAFRQTYLRFAERTMNHVLTPAWWDAERRYGAGARVDPARLESINRFFRERAPFLSVSLARDLGLPPPRVARVEVQGGGRLTIDGFPQRGRYEGRYFEGGALEVDVPLDVLGRFRYFTVNGRREVGPRLRLPATEDLDVVAHFGG